MRSPVQQVCFTHCFLEIKQAQNEATPCISRGDTLLSKGAYFKVSLYQWCRRLSAHPPWSSVSWCLPYWLSLLPRLEFRMLSLVSVCLSGFCVEWRVTVSSHTCDWFFSQLCCGLLSHTCVPSPSWDGTWPHLLLVDPLFHHGQISTKPIMRQTIYSTNWLAAFGLMGPGRFTSAALAWRFEWRFGHCVAFSFQAPPHPVSS